MFVTIQRGAVITIFGVRQHGDINPGEQRLFVASGKGGRERIAPVSGRFFEALGEYLPVRAAARGAERGVLRGAEGPAAGNAVDGGGVG